MSESLEAKLKDLSFNKLVFFMEDLAHVMKYEARQDASDDEWRDAQAMCVVEEAGEFIAAYRRWRGFARRDGTWADVSEELSDVVISSMLMFAVMHEDSQRHIREKLAKVITRGYVNKD